MASNNGQPKLAPSDRWHWHAFMIIQKVSDAGFVVALCANARKPSRSLILSWISEDRTQHHYGQTIDAEVVESMGYGVAVINALEAALESQRDAVKHFCDVDVLLAQWERR